MLIGAFDSAETAILRRAVERASSDAHVSRSILESQKELIRLRPRCICVDGDGAELAATTTWIREHASLFSTPVIAMVSCLRDSSFVDAYRHGADDVIVRSNIGGVTRRIANLQSFDPTVRPPINQGRVLISYPSDEYRRLIGRVLRNAGFDVQFAVGADEIVEAMASDTPPELVVVSDELLSVYEVDRPRQVAHAAKTPFIVVTANTATPTKQDPNLEAVAIVSRTAPPDHLLFLANDLLTRGGHQRQSPRYLFDTICSFRTEGAFSPEYGLTYNLSETGIYVRTLDPPPSDARLWLELRPPGFTETVHLRGKLVWRAIPGQRALTTPPGFGLQIEAESSPARDLQLYRRAYNRLAAVPHQLAVSWRP